MTTDHAGEQPSRHFWRTTGLLGLLTTVLALIGIGVERYVNTDAPAPSPPVILRLEPSASTIPIDVYAEASGLDPNSQYELREADRKFSPRNVTSAPTGQLSEKLTFNSASDPGTYKVQLYRDGTLVTSATLELTRKR
ncbi:hypothetical protein [Nocardia australiensis]|uniref:hypothetical protein n=1 Tax=Nocardia australiensis TaxID=2887191 RepID=UPI001D14A10E|nr:hypothetical protein [Nocardia australiensis]